MSKNRISAEQIKKSVMISISAQIISLAVSFVLNLIVPKFIDEYQYAYWQTFMLYISYVGLLHFGLLDGIVLRYSQYDYAELDKKKVRSQFFSLLFLDSLLAGIIIFFTFSITEDITAIIIIFIAIGIITRNAFTYTSYCFQITNRISQYALLIVVQRMFYGIGIFALLMAGVKEFYWFCAVDLLSDILGILLGVKLNRKLYIGSISPLKECVTETRMNINAGIRLLIANWASNFLVGGAKMVIQWNWSTLVFGKVTFAFSVTNLFLNFINAISVVLFPSLKRMDMEELPLLYKKIRDIMSPVLFGILLFYFPGCLILEAWIPKYTQSLAYLGIILPIIVFASKVSILTNNYLKAYREERNMLKINLFSICIAMVGYLANAYLLNNIVFLLLWLVAVIMVRSILSEIVVMRLIQMVVFWDFVMEVAMTIFFIVCTKLGSTIFGAAIYSIGLLLYIFVNRNSRSMVIGTVKKRKTDS